MAGGTGEPQAPILLLLLGLEADQRGAAKAAFWPSYPPYDLWVECPLSTFGDTGSQPHNSY